MAQKQFVLGNITTFSKAAIAKIFGAHASPQRWHGMTAAGDQIHSVSSAYDPKTGKITLKKQGEPDFDLTVGEFERLVAGANARALDLSIADGTSSQAI